MKRHFTIVIVLLLQLSTALAQSSLIPTNVVAIQTGGWWQANGTSGTYRVIVTSHGWEHVWSKVVVEWLSEPKTPDSEQVVLQSMELLPPVSQGTMVLAALLRPLKPGEVAIQIEATPNNEVKAQPQRFTFCAQQPGIATPCKR